MYQFTLVLVLSWFAYAPMYVQAQGLYKWVDSQGIVHYTNTPTNAKAKTVDDALPPAANFQRPIPPPEPAAETAKPNTGGASAPANTPREAISEPTTDGSASTPPSSATEERAPDLSAAQPAE